VEIIEGHAFRECWSLREEVKFTGVRIIEEDAFSDCTALTDVEFGDKLETIGRVGIQLLHRSIRKLPKIRSIGNFAFYNCKQLTEVELSKDLETLGERAFAYCIR
jgi:hypothetical protein